MAKPDRFADLYDENNELKEEIEEKAVVLTPQERIEVELEVKRLTKSIERADKLIVTLLAFIIGIQSLTIILSIGSTL